MKRSLALVAALTFLALGTLVGLGIASVRAPTASKGASQKAAPIERAPGVPTALDVAEPGTAESDIAEAREAAWPERDSPRGEGIAAAGPRPSQQQALRALEAALARLDGCPAAHDALDPAMVADPDAFVAEMRRRPTNVVVTRVLQALVRSIDDAIGAAGCGDAPSEGGAADQAPE